MNSKRDGKRAAAGRPRIDPRAKRSQITLTMPPEKIATLKLISGGRGITPGAHVSSLIP